jgi:hypothetical protein
MTENAMTERQRTVRDAIVEGYIETGKSLRVADIAARLKWSESRVRRALDPTGSVYGVMPRRDHVDGLIQPVWFYAPATWYLRLMIISLRAEAVRGALLLDACRAADDAAGHTHITPAGQPTRPVVAVPRHLWETIRVHLGGSLRGEFLTLRKANGNLELIPTPTGIGAAKAYLVAREGGNAEHGSDDQMHMMLADFLESGWLRVLPEHVGALTDAYMLSDDGTLSDKGRWAPTIEHARVYAHMNYQVEDPIETWAAGKVVQFDGAEVERIAASKT